MASSIKLLLFLSLFGGVLFAPPQENLRIPSPSNLEECKEIIFEIAGSTKPGRTNRIIKTMALMEGTQKEKCALWEGFVVEIKKKFAGFKGERTNLPDGSVAYTGHAGETLIINPQGDVYLTNSYQVQKPLSKWTPPFHAMTRLKDKYLPHQKLTGRDQFDRVPIQ